MIFVRLHSKLAYLWLELEWLGSKFRVMEEIVTSFEVLFGVGLGLLLGELTYRRLKKNRE